MSTPVSHAPPPPSHGRLAHASLPSRGRPAPVFIGLLFSLLLSTPSPAATLDVATSDELRAAARQAKPGDTLRLTAGTYAPDVSLSHLHGTEGHPITIEGASPDTPPLFANGAQALHLSDCSHVVLRHLLCSGQSSNGINIDDGGPDDTPSHHITLQHITVRHTGPRGNHDAIKLSGVTDFTLRHCRVEGWGGQALDMVGCHRGLVEDCTFEGREGFTQSTGPQTKGGSSDVTFRRCRFDHAGDRALNVGGSTGLDYFRPKDAPHEAARITVEGCTFVGSATPLAFVGVDGATVRYNTIVHPRKWVLRILQESRADRFTPCRNVRLHRNLILFRHADCPAPINIGPGTAPDTFRFSENLWYCDDAPHRSRPALPTEELDGRYTTNPTLSDTHVPPAESPAAAYGAAALPPQQPTR